MTFTFSWQPPRACLPPCRVQGARQVLVLSDLRPLDPQLSAKVAHLTTGLQVKEGRTCVWGEAWPSPCPRRTPFHLLYPHWGPLDLPGARPMTWGPPPCPAPALPHWARPVCGRAPPAPGSHLPRSPPCLGCGDIRSENTLDKEMDQTHARGGRGQDIPSTLELTMSEAGVRTKARRETGLEGH